MSRKARLAAERDQAELSATTAQMLSEAREDVTRADQKASVLLAALGIGFAAVLGGQLAGHFDSSKLSPYGQIFWWAGVIAAVASVVLAAISLWPRYKLNDRPEHGITYWGHIAAFKTLQEFEASLEDQGPATNARGRHQLWRLSRLVLLKYRLLRASIICTGGAGFLLGLASTIIR